LRVSLIYPGISVAERYGVDIGDIGGRQAPLGLLGLAAYLRQQTHELQFIDAEAEGLTDDEVIRRLQEFSPAVAGISLTTVAFPNARRLAEKIKENLPELLLVVGGPQVTADPEGTMFCQSFDAGIYGEGELTFAELLDQLAQQESYLEINGLVYRQNDAEVKINPPREPIPELDNLPHPARDLLADIKLYRPPVGCYRAEFVPSLITSRGCPYGCIFCDNNTFGRKIRYFSPEYVADEIEQVLKDCQARELTFVDDTFPCNRQRFQRILGLIKEKRLHFVWTCMANVNDLDDSILRQMKEAGCWQIALGIESGDEEILEFIRKSISLEKIRETVTAAHQVGIQVKGFFMLGHPTETPDTLQKTMRLALELPFTDVVCTIATPVRGTAFYDLAVGGDYGSFEADAGSERLNYWEPVFVPSALTAEQLYQAQRDFYRRFYLRPGIFWRQLGKIRNVTIFWRMLVAAVKVIRLKSKH